MSRLMPKLAEVVIERLELEWRASIWPFQRPARSNNRSLAAVLQQTPETPYRTVRTDRKNPPSSKHLVHSTRSPRPTALPGWAQCATAVSALHLESSALSLPRKLLHQKHTPPHRHPAIPTNRNHPVHWNTHLFAPKTRVFPKHPVPCGQWHRPKANQMTGLPAKNLRCSTILRTTLLLLPIPIVPSKRPSQNQ